jgi:hypothetical protein
VKTLADFKRLCQEGAQFHRRIFGTTCTGQPVKDRMATVAIVQSNAVVFVPAHLDPTSENIAWVKQNPHANGSWFWFPKAAHCRIENGELFVLNQRGGNFMSFRPDIPPIPPTT